jgi:threonine/homoserine/homoserine lactone efflux protein
MAAIEIPQLVVPLATVMFVMSITPGPNNIMVLSSGARFGVRHTLPHLMGITLGFIVLLATMYAGLASVVTRLPVLQSMLTVSCSAYLIWIAWKLLGARRKNANPEEHLERARPWRWFEAVAFQLVNPKGWGMAVSCAGLVTKQGMVSGWGLALLIGAAVIINFPSVCLWAICGATVSRWLDTPLRFRIFNGAMALLLLMTAIWMLRGLQ